MKRCKKAFNLQRLAKNEFGTAWLLFIIVTLIDDMPSKKIMDLGRFKDITYSGNMLGAEIKWGTIFGSNPIIHVNCETLV